MFEKTYEISINRKKLIIIGVSVLAFVIIVMALHQMPPVVMFNKIAQSHISGHVPKAADFDNVLKRDLEGYFKTTFTADRVSVKYEYLREGATQTGVAFPKYYLWGTILDGDKIIEDGAIRVAAIEKTRFEVTDFLKRNEINKDTICTVFPAPVCKRIKEKLNK